jgi:hypothetical protein
MAKDQRYPVSSSLKPSGKKGGFSLSFSPNFEARGGSRLLTDVTTFDRTLDAPGLRNAMTRWVQQSLNAHIPMVVKRVLLQRSGRLAQARAWISSIDHQGGEREEKSVFTIRVNLGGAMMYGGTQEHGRKSKTRSGSGYYMVPISKNFETKNTLWNQATISAALNRPGVFWAPKGKGNYFTDKRGNPVKYVFQMNEAFRAKYKRGAAAGRIAKGITAARNAAISEAEKQKQRTQKKSLSKREKLKQWAKILFVAYPKHITSIPGESAYAKRPERSASISNSPAAKEFMRLNKDQDRGFGPGEASRWWSRALAESVKDLDKHINDPEMRRLIRAGAMAAMNRAAGITGSGRRIKPKSTSVDFSDED